MPGMKMDDERYIGFLISDVARLMRTVFDRRVHELGLTRAQWLALTRLHRKPGAIQSELADMMELEKASVGRIIDRLERKGWVRRKPDPSDRRVNRIYLTPEAVRIHTRMSRIAEATVNDSLIDLSEAEADQLATLMLQVKGRLLQIAGDNNQPAAAQTASARNRKTATRSIASRPASRPRNKSKLPADADKVVIS